MYTQIKEDCYQTIEEYPLKECGSGNLNLHYSIVIMKLPAPA